MDRRPLGIFDSGLGGVSTLRQALHMLPGENFLYYGDNAHAPYGSRSPGEILELSGNAIRFLMEKNVKAVLLACNTSTAVALPTLKERFPLPILGIEPAILPASRIPGDGLILMMATEATARHPRYQALRAQLPDPARVQDIPCSAEFVRRVEEGRFEAGAYDDLFLSALGPFAGRRVDAIVLGCTHYPFFQPQLLAYANAHFEGTPLFFEGGQAAITTMQLLLRERGLLSPDGGGQIEFFTSGAPERYRPIFESLLRQPMHIQGILL